MALAYLQDASSTTDADTYTFSAQNVGTAAADRYIAVGVVGRDTGTTTGTVTVTVGGNSAAEAVGQWSVATNKNWAGLNLAALTTGTTADVVVTFHETILRAAIALWRMDDLASATAHDFGASTSDPAADTNVVPTDGCAIGMAISGGSGTWAWTGITGNDDVIIEATAYSAASDSFPSGDAGLAVSADYSGSAVNPAGVFASWGFGAAAGGSVGHRIVGGGWGGRIIGA